MSRETGCQRTKAAFYLLPTAVQRLMRRGKYVTGTADRPRLNSVNPLLLELTLVNMALNYGHDIRGDFGSLLAGSLRSVKSTPRWALLVLRGPLTLCNLGST